MESEALSNCIVCGEPRPFELSTFVGPRAYCLSCFHGWRLEDTHFPYDQVAQVPQGTSASRVLDQIEFFRRFTPDNARVLEVGCATGELAAAVRTELNIAAFEAIELSPLAEQAREHVDRMHRRPVTELIEANELKRQFDLIVMSHVLEHIANPRAELAALRQVLAPGGRIFLEVPNRSGNRMLNIDDNRSHLHFFSPSSLTRLLAMEDYEVIAAETGAYHDPQYSDCLRVIATVFAPPDISEKRISDHPALAGVSSLAVWGAGTLASELLANGFDMAKVAFFVDRDPAKIGSTLFGKLVVGPDALGMTPQTVLICSVEFAEDVASDIRALYPDAGHRLVTLAELLRAEDLDTKG
jgi:SAM-dependent methyltransferase